MSIEELRNEFLVDDDLGEEKLASVIKRLLPICVVDKRGSVEIKRGGLSGRQLVKVVLAARLIAHVLDQAISDELNAEELAANTGLPKNQASARAKEAFDEKFADRTARGNYRARMRKIHEFLDELTGKAGKEHGHD